MVHSIVEDVIASCPHHILPTVQGEPEYHTINSISKMLRANARSIESHWGACSWSPRYHPIHHELRNRITRSPVGESGITRRGTNEIVGGTAAALLAERHRWEEAERIFRTWTNVEQALKKQIITAFETRYLEIINSDMVVFTNTTARDIL
jgi:hypothetical protein